MAEGRAYAQRLLEDALGKERGEALMSRLDQVIASVRAEVLGSAGEEPLDELGQAQATERALRQHLAQLLQLKAQAQREASRLARRSQLPQSDAALRDVVHRYGSHIGALDREATQLREAVSSAEALVERLRQAKLEESNES